MEQDEHVLGLGGDLLLNRIERQLQDLRDSLHEARVAANDAEGRAYWSWVAAQNYSVEKGAENSAELMTLVQELAGDMLRLRKQVHKDSLEIAGKASHVLDVVRATRKV